jgi:cell division protein FtsQ
MSTAPPTTDARAVGGAIAPMDPRIRARRIAVKRAEGRRRLRILATGLGLVAMVGLALMAVRSPLVSVRHVTVQGADHTPMPRVIAAAGLQGHRLMFDVHPGAVDRRLVASLPWVASASVRRHWPATVEIRLQERSPIATIAASGGQSALVDATGRILAIGPPAAFDPSLLSIAGLPPAGTPGSWIGPQAQPALVVAGGLPAPLRARLSQLSVSPAGEVEGVLAKGATVLFGPPTDLAEKFLALSTLLDRVDLKGVAGIDVRLPDAPVLTHE